MLYEKYIKVFDNVLPLASLTSLIKWLNLQHNNKSFVQGKVGGHGDSALSEKVRKVQILDFSTKSTSLTNVHWHHLLSHIFLHAAKAYTEIFPYSRGIIELNQLNALRYEKTGHYKYHVDGGQGHRRTLSAILFLNNDYKGGELCFDNDGTDFKIPAKPSSLVLWPSNFLFPHTIKPVTEGVRFSIVGWMD